MVKQIPDPNSQRARFVRIERAIVPAMRLARRPVVACLRTAKAVWKFAAADFITLPLWGKLAVTGWLSCNVLFACLVTAGHEAPAPMEWVMAGAPVCLVGFVACAKTAEGLTRLAKRLRA